MDESGEATRRALVGSGQGAVYRLIWWPLFLVVTAATLAGLYTYAIPYNVQTRPLAEAGLRWHWDNQTTGQPLGEEARAAGIEAGRTVVSVNGTAPAPGNHGQSVLDLLRTVEGDTVELVTRGPAGDLRTHRIRRGPHHLEQAYAESPIGFTTIWWTEMSIDFLSAVLGLVAAFLLYRQHRRDWVAAILSLAFVLLCGDANASWSAFFVFDLRQIPFVFKIFGYAALLTGILLFPDGRFSPSWARWLALIIWGWALAAILSELGGLGFGAEVMSLAGGGFALLSVAFLVARYRRLPPSIERQQIRWATFGFLMGAILAAASILANIFMVRTEDPAVYALIRIVAAVTTPAAQLALAAGLLVSVLRFRLYDVDLVISRSAAVAALTLALAAIYAAASQTIEALFQSSFGGEAGVWPGAVGAALAVILFVPLNNRIQAWAERHFQKGVLHLRRDLPDCVGDLRETASLSELLVEILERVRSGTSATAAAVEVGGRIAARVGDEAPMPLRVPLRIVHRGEEVGALLLSARPDGTLPGHDEREALEEAADSIARAIHVVARREAREEALERRVSSLEQAFLSFARRQPQPDAAE